jgi:hypothetical protein
MATDIQHNANDAIDVLKADHAAVEILFEAFERTDDGILTPKAR